MSIPTIKERNIYEIIEQQYQVNDCLVATAPIVIPVIETKHFSAKVKVAEFKGNWAYGYDWWIKFGANPGGGCLPNFDPEHESFPTKEEAIKAGLNKLLEKFTKSNPGRSNYVCEGDDDAPNKGHDLDKTPAIAVIKSLLYPAPKQLELF